MGERMPLSYDGLYTLRISPSLVQTNTLLLHPTDSVGNLLNRPTIDEEDAPAEYSVELQSGSAGSASTGAVAATPSSSSASPSSSHPHPHPHADSGGNASSIDPSPSGTTTGGGGGVLGAITSIHLLDPLTDALLATTFSSTPNKTRHVQLHNPPLLVELRNRSLLSYEWKFYYEGCRFAWARSRDSLSTRESGYTCKLARKPDPDVAIAVYKPAKKGNLLQVLDYNLNRFTFEDRKGLEVLLLSTLFSLLYGDKLDDGIQNPNYPIIAPLTKQLTSGSAAQDPEVSSSGVGDDVAVTSSLAPRPPPTRNMSDEVETIAPNEVVISNHLSEQAYIEHCIGLLQDPTLVYLCLVAESQETVPRAIRISSEVKRLKAKYSQQRKKPRQPSFTTPTRPSSTITTHPPPPSAADTDEDELMTFIDYPGRSSTRLRSTDRHASRENKTSSSSGEDNRSPPDSIKIYLSRIPLEEFTPGKAGKDADPDQHPSVPQNAVSSSPSPYPSTTSPSPDTGRAGSNAKPPLTTKPPLPPKSNGAGHARRSGAGGTDPEVASGGAKKKSLWSRAMSS